ncbi:UDP-N-acetyl-D-mannosamine dehydrogenase, partial [Listeria sp. W9-0585]|nr:UDP-N-acetyl-D-mannosamine dehydrogenase [Listeria rustica]MBA3927941.1 UDP-N-acetyl-D-mannosamine dehydrogenase [Listeria rustica]
IGLPTAIMFANHGQNVIGIDLKEDAVNMLNAGKIHIEEPGLQTELTKALLSGNFKAQLNLEESDVFIIAVPTPNKADAYLSCDLTHVVDAVSKTIPYLEKGNVI